MRAISQGSSTIAFGDYCCNYLLSTLAVLLHGSLITLFLSFTHHALNKISHITGILLGSRDQFIILQYCTFQAGSKSSIHECVLVDTKPAEICYTSICSHHIKYMYHQCTQVGRIFLFFLRWSSTVVPRCPDSHCLGEC